MKSENGHSTELVIDEMERKDDLADSDFTPQARLEHPSMGFTRSAPALSRRPHS